MVPDEPSSPVPFPYDIMGDEAPRDALAGIDRNSDLVTELQHLFGEAGHVFKRHPEGVWGQPGGHKDRYANVLLEILDRYPGLVRRLLSVDNRIVKTVTYRALEIRQAKSPGK
jgi:hypothetical protein